MTKRKGGLISEHSDWIGRWGTYWRIQKWGVVSPMAEQLAIKYPKTWELRLVLWQQKQISKVNEQCLNSQSSTGSSSRSS